jgi:DNA-binding PadR family transcriptional regulator
MGSARRANLAADLISCGIMRGRHLPELTHLQFLVLSILRAEERPGRVLREALAAYGVRRSAAAFYQMMARLERDHLVEGHYGRTIVGDQTLTERRYEMTPAGARMWADTRAFYESVGVAALKHRLSNA